MGVVYTFVRNTFTDSDRHTACSFKSLRGSDPPLVLPDGCQQEVGLLVGGEDALGPGGDTAATQPLPPTQGVELLQVQLCSSGEADEGGR